VREDGYPKSTGETIEVVVPALLIKHSDCLRNIVQGCLRDDSIHLLAKAQYVKYYGSRIILHPPAISTNNRKISNKLETDQLQCVEWNKIITMSGWCKDLWTRTQQPQRSKEGRELRPGQYAGVSVEVLHGYIGR
jgi:hypothetical protein